ncbi:armadillo-type protein [Umbelopsis sp. AD052]|nr:armadillo-type protein [Umbelopsis sp. AD052]
MADLGIDFDDEDDGPFQPSSPPDPPHHLTLDEPQLLHAVLSGTLTDQGQLLPELMTDQSDTAFEQQQDSQLPETYLEGSDGYVDVVSDDAEPMAMTREMTPEELDDDELIIDESLTPIERMSMFVKSSEVVHRLLVARELPISLENMSTPEAVTLALPMVQALSKDVDDTVRETFVVELDKIIMYYYRNAPPIIDQDTRRHDINFIEPQTTNPKSTIETEMTEAGKDDDEMQEDSNSDNAEPNDLCEVSSGPSPATKMSPALSVDAAHTSEDKTDSYHIPQHIFSNILIELLIDQNSNLASLAQQCIVSVVYQLTNIASGDTATESESISPSQAQKLLDDEIVDGIINGLLSIAGRIKTALYESSRGENGSQSSVGSPESQANNQKAVFQMSDDIDQGEINLCKMVSLSLIASLASYLGEERCTKIFMPIVEEMAKDNVFYVRKEAAAAIGSIATIVNQAFVIEKLLPLYEGFSKDTIWHVRRSATLTLPILCGVLPVDLKTKLAVDGVELFMNDVSRNVRNMLAEIIGELITKFLPEGWEESRQPGEVPIVLIEFFLSLGAHASNKQAFKMDSDRAIICAFNFPAVAFTAGVDLWDTHLKDTYLTLTKDYQIKVRRTFAYSLHEIARIIGPDRTEHDLVQIFALYLMDLDEVKQGVLEHLSDFLAALAPSSRDEYIPILAEVWDGVMTNWRLRDILAGQLKDISLLFDPTRVVEHVVPLALRACQDEFASVRETGVSCFPTLLEIVKQAIDENKQGENDDASSEELDDNTPLELLGHIMERVDEFARSERFRNRMVFAQISKALLDAGISAWDFHSFFLPRLDMLANDLVVNVRIAVARAFKTICEDDEMRQALVNLDTTKEDTVRHSRPLEEILLTLALDENKNVQSFVIQYVDQQALSRRQQERALEAIASAAEDDTFHNDDQQPPGTPMDYSSGEDEDDVNQAPVHQVELSELPLSSPNLAEGNKSDFDVHSIDFTKDTLADPQEAFVELKPTLDDVDDDNEEEEFIYRPSTPVESSDSN